MIDHLFCDTPGVTSSAVADVSGIDLNNPDNNTKKILFTPSNIILGKFILLNANIFHKYTSADQYNQDGTLKYYDYEKNSSDKNTLRETVAKWYYALRNFSIVALLSVLVYVAIRMVISSVSTDKAKYKMMLKDWAIALCLIIFMHFIMIGLLEISTLITEAVGGASGGYDLNNCRFEIAKTINEMNEATYSSSAGLGGSLGNLFGQLATGMTNIIIYVVMFVFTLIFAFKYLIRAITIMFLTIIGPVTAITYSIDKISDGKAQAYNTWFKEYLYNSIIQPFHLLIYIVLVGAASDLAESNFLYCIASLYAIIPSEKLVKQMFGIKNQSGGGDLGAVAKAAAATSGIKSLMGKSGGKGGVNKKQGGEDSKDSPELPPRQKDEKEIEAYDNNGGRNLTEGQNTDTPESKSSATDLDWNPDDHEDLTAEEKMQIGNEEHQKYMDSHQTSQQEEENELMTSMHGDEYESVEDWKNDKESDYADVAEKMGWNEKEENKEAPQPESEQKTVGSENTNSKSDGNSNTSNNKASKFQNARRAMGAEVGRKIRKKFGTTSPKKLAGKAFKKVGGTATRLLAKTAGAAVGGAIGLGVGLATGDLGSVVAGLSAGAGLGARAGQKVDSAAKRVIGGAAGLGKIGIDAARGKDTLRENARKSFMNNQKEIDYARDRLTQKNGGVIPSGREINEELAKRWQFREQGITNNDVIDGAVDLLDEKRVEVDEKKEEVRNSLANDEAYTKVEKMLSENTDYAEGYRQLMKNDEREKQIDKELKEGNINDKQKEKLEKEKKNIGDFRKNFDETYDKDVGASAAMRHQAKKQEAEKIIKDTEKRTMTQATVAARIASEHSSSDFRDERKMSGLQKTMSEQYANQTNSSPEHSKEVVRRAIEDAAKVRGVKNPNLRKIINNERG